MLKIWGRNDGSNVIKVLWCLNELGVEYERIDWGGEFGGNDDLEYRRKNPMGRLPTLEEEDGFTLWESGAVVRYLCARYSMGNMCPESLRDRAQADRWMDWCSLNLAPFNSVFLNHFWRLPEAERSQDTINAAIKTAIPMFDILDAQLADNDFVSGDHLTMADIPAGVMTHRWINWSPSRPSHPNVEAWHARLLERPAFQKHVEAVTRPAPPR